MRVSWVASGGSSAVDGDGEPRSGKMLWACCSGEDDSADGDAREAGRTNACGGKDCAGAEDGSTRGDPLCLERAAGDAPG